MCRKGPLQGWEQNIRKIDRHKRIAFLKSPDETSELVAKVGLEITEDAANLEMLHSISSNLEHMEIRNRPVEWRIINERKLVHPRLLWQKAGAGL